MTIEADDLVYDSGYSCVYSLTSTEVPYITYIPDKTGQKIENLVMMAGLSGVGAKGALAYGELASALILNQEPIGSAMKNVMKEMGFSRLQEEMRSLD